MDTLQAFLLSSAAWFALQALGLLLTPQLVVTILESRTSSDLERYLCRELGFAQLVLALASVLGLSADGDDTRSALGQMAETAATAGADNSQGAFTVSPSTRRTVPRTVPLLTLFHACVAIHAYVHSTSTSTTFDGGYFPPAAIVSGGLAVFGTWCVLFGADPHRISKRTGKDRHAANWPFGESEKRKERKER